MITENDVIRAAYKIIGGKVNHDAEFKDIAKELGSSEQEVRVVAASVKRKGLAADTFGFALNQAGIEYARTLAGD